jgi:phage terminase large subunit
MVMTPKRIVDASFPAMLENLFKPVRYKVLHGGRGSGKSWAAARALLIQGVREPLRILCAREVQRSIKESVHQLLGDQIKELGLGAFWQVLDNEMRGRNGAKIAFTGLAAHTTESVKSYEGYDRVWIEEAQTVSKRSWDILTPTIRKPQSEIWLTLNPDLLTGETYARFVVAPPPDSWVCQINYLDNPWFPEVLDKERAHCAGDPAAGGVPEYLAGGAAAHGGRGLLRGSD